MEGALKISINLPLPSRALNPHAKGHWRAKHRATKTAREEAKLMALCATNGAKPMMDKAVVHVIYDTTSAKHIKGYRPLDEQNANAAVKAYIDGCKDAGIIVDDSAKHLKLGKTDIVKNGKPGVTLIFEELES
jgi:hypothetical protein